MHSTILTLIFIFFIQYFFQIARTVGTLHNVRGDMRETLIYTFVIQVLWLLSTYIGVVSIMHKDWKAVGVFMVAGMLGSWHGIKIIKKKRKKDV